MHRLASVDDYSRVVEIERAAGELFRTIDMAVIADDQPISRRGFERFVVDSGAFVWMIEGEVVAYLLVEQIDAAAHVEQVTVHSDNARHGVGAQLIALADSWAAERGLVSVTLTTFRDVPWNAPYYERLGFRALPPSGWGSNMSARMGAEAARGLEAWPRLAMSRPVHGVAAGTEGTG
jgi:GNAT superfamily N-acetyltransferase